FPWLGEPDVLRRLVREEARARRRGGESPVAEEYHSRFPELTLQASLVGPDGPMPHRDSVLPTVPGYELQGELGRGAMGVVYKARQTNLNRTVALKLIQGNAAQAQALLARFKTEAEAVARLAHPNIVQVFEVGERAGQNGDPPAPFLVLEYVEGGS